MIRAGYPEVVEIAEQGVPEMYQNTISPFSMQPTYQPVRQPAYQKPAGLMGNSYDNYLVFEMMNLAESARQIASLWQQLMTAPVQLRNPSPQAAASVPISSHQQAPAVSSSAATIAPAPADRPAASGETHYNGQNFGYWDFKYRGASEREERKRVDAGASQQEKDVRIGRGRDLWGIQYDDQGNITKMSFDALRAYESGLPDGDLPWGIESYLDRNPQYLAEHSQFDAQGHLSPSRDRLRAAKA